MTATTLMNKNRHKHGDQQRRLIVANRMAAVDQVKAALNVNHRLPAP